MICLLLGLCDFLYFIIAPIFTTPLAYAQFSYPCQSLMDNTMTMRWVHFEGLIHLLDVPDGDSWFERLWVKNLYFLCHSHISWFYFLKKLRKKKWNEKKKVKRKKGRCEVFSMVAINSISLYQLLSCSFFWGFCDYFSVWVWSYALIFIVAEVF